MVLGSTNPLNTAVQSFVEHIQEALDKQLYVIGICLDLIRAYDDVNHPILLDKLEFYGIRGPGKAWFESYLSNRLQFVEITHTDYQKSTQNSFSSKSRKLHFGIPQRSILGPVLFLLYINNLTTSIKDVKMVLYADDTNILVTNNNKVSLNTKLTMVMMQLEEWLSKNELVVHTQDTSVIYFHNRHHYLCEKKVYVSSSSSSTPFTPRWNIGS
jgi:hypothetical protein